MNYFGNCYTVEEMVLRRSSLFEEINQAFSDRLEEISKNTNTIKNSTKKVMSLPEVSTIETFSAFPIRSNNGNASEIIFHQDGTVTI